MIPERPAALRIAMRSERLAKLIDLKAPQSIVGRERWLLQKAIDEWTQARGELIAIERSAD